MLDSWVIDRPFVVSAINLGVLISPTVVQRLLLVLIGLSLALFTARYPIFLLLRLAKIPDPTLTATEHAVGRIIGYIERLLAFCFVLDDADNAIAMLIAAKGVYRLHELGVGKQPTKSDASAEERIQSDREADEKTFYIMIGTFTSIAYAIVIAFATCFALQAIR